jgi:hypothetical protein
MLVGAQQGDAFQRFDRFDRGIAAPVAWRHAEQGNLDL